MIQPLTLHWPRVIEFGAGKIRTLHEHLKNSKRVFFLVDKPIMSAVSPILRELENTGITIGITTDVVPEPPFETLEKLLKPVNIFNPTTIVGIGGGSTMDLAKLVSVLFTGSQNAADIIGINNVTARIVKLITASTTSGTGSEVTPIAVLTDAQQKLKKGVVSPWLVPDVAIVDPELMLSMPPAVTASTGMDAMTHCIEAFTNCHSHPIIDNLALEGIRLISRNIQTAVSAGDSIEARTAMALGSLYGGFCLGPVNTAAVHALAYPLGGEFKIPHGVANSVLLPFVMKFNLTACTEKYAIVARVLGIDSDDPFDVLAEKAIQRIRTISNKCGIPQGLRELNIPADAIPSMAKAAMEVKRLLSNNPRTLSEADAAAIFQMAYEGKIEEN